jgi:hypothetical protein
MPASVSFNKKGLSDFALKGLGKRNQMLSERFHFVPYNNNADSDEIPVPGRHIHLFCSKL